MYVWDLLGFILQVNNLMTENSKLKKQVEEKEEKEKQFMEERRELLLKQRNQDKTSDDKTSISKAAVPKKPDLRQVQRGSSQRAFGLVDSGEEKTDESKVRSFFRVVLLRFAEASRFVYQLIVFLKHFPLGIRQNKLQRCNSL